jgi:hypothetical protein
LSALSSWYYLFYIAYFIVFHAVYTAIRNRSWPAGWHLVAPLACIVGAIVALSPLVVPMIAAARRGARVYQGGHDKYVADVLAYVGFPALHVLSSLGEWIYRRVTGNPWEATVYLGLVNLAVIAWLYLGVKDKNTRLLAYTLSGMVLFCILASGDSLHVLGRRTIPMPGQLLSSLPFFGNVRTPSRAIVFVYLFLAIIIGHAGAVAWQLRRRPAIRWGAPIVVALMILDFYPAGALGMTPVSCSSGLLIIRDDPERGFGVLQVASGKRGAYDEGNYFMLQQVCHGRPICDGNVSRNLVRTLRDRLEVTDLQRQRQQLQESRVKYIVMNREVGDLFPWRVDDELRNRYLAVYPIVYDGSDFTIVRVY